MIFEDLNGGVTPNRPNLGHSGSAGVRALSVEATLRRSAVRWPYNHESNLTAYG
jgi:hypothetical protein